MRKCTNCLKQYEKEEKCSKCGKTLGAEFICVRIGKISAHFCSKKCANKLLVVASYPEDKPKDIDSPGGYECKKCGYHFFPSEMGTDLKICPECASPNLTQLKSGATRGRSFPGRGRLIKTTQGDRVLANVKNNLKSRL